MFGNDNRPIHQLWDAIRKAEARIHVLELESEGRARREQEERLHAASWVRKDRSAVHPIISGQYYIEEWWPPSSSPVRARGYSRDEALKLIAAVLPCPTNSKEINNAVE